MRVVHIPTCMPPAAARWLRDLGRDALYVVRTAAPARLACRGTAPDALPNWRYRAY